MKKILIRLIFVLAVLAFATTSSQASSLVTLVEAGHTLTKLVDSVNPLHASQTLLDTGCQFGNGGNIESVGIDKGTGTLYVQVSSGGFQSSDTCIFSVSPTGVVTLINPSTGFGINSRGTDLHFDPTTGLLLTQDKNPSPDRIATVHPITGAVGTYANMPASIFGDGTFGMDFSTGAGGSVVPSGDVVFTSDVIANGIHSTPLGGPVATHLVPPIAGDDIVIQPDGDWVHVPDFSGIISAYLPNPPFTSSPSPMGLDIQGIFASAALPFVFGSRATVCDVTGDLYISYSGAPGGTGIFRVDESLTTATLILTITDGGLQDLILGPSTSGGPGSRSVYFTVHSAGGEEVWEVTLPECNEEPTAIDLASFEVEADDGQAMVIWETATEIDNAGFNIYRALSADGPWLQINSTLIAAEGDPVSGAQYSLVDTPGRGNFYYRLEDIDFFGLSTLHEPALVEMGAAIRSPWFRPSLPPF